MPKMDQVKLLQNLQRLAPSSPLCLPRDSRGKGTGPTLPIGRFGSTDASVSLARVNAWVNAERPSFLCDYVQRKKAHRPGISSLLLTLGLCSVALSFALPYLLPPTRDAGSTLGQRWVNAPCFSPALASRGNDQCSPHPGPTQAEPPAQVCLDVLVSKCVKVCCLLHARSHAGAPSRTAS